MQTNKHTSMRVPGRQGYCRTALLLTLHKSLVTGLNHHALTITAAHSRRHNKPSMHAVSTVVSPKKRQQQAQCPSTAGKREDEHSRQHLVSTK